ncbi:MAG TPA: hypothetical protein VJN50_02265 [Actinomycetota bacterium]|nr:hypothetical protein [Actinomycetota bacterium]
MGSPGLAPARAAPVDKAGRVRVLAELDPRDSRDYASAVARVVAEIERSLRPEVRANRTRVVGQGLALAPWGPAWRRFSSSTLAMARRHRGTAVVADVSDCYATIAPTAVDRALRAVGCEPALVGPVLRLLERYGRDGIRGLPVGPDPSAPATSDGSTTSSCSSPSEGRPSPFSMRSTRPLATPASPSTKGRRV